MSRNCKLSLYIFMSLSLVNWLNFRLNCSYFAAGGMWLIPSSQKENDTVAPKYITGWKRFRKPFLFSQWHNSFIIGCRGFQWSPLLGTLIFIQLSASHSTWRKDLEDSLHTSLIRRALLVFWPPVHDAHLTSNAALVNCDALCMSGMQIEESWGVLYFLWSERYISMVSEN